MKKRKLKEKIKRLKEKNASLQREITLLNQDVHFLVTAPDSYEGQAVKARHHLMLDTNFEWWRGDSTATTKGIFPQIEQQSCNK